MKAQILFLLVACSMPMLVGAEITVDFNKGNDAAQGTSEMPLRTFQKAVETAKPGDTINLAPSDQPLFLSLQMNNCKGITVNGNFNTLTGSRLLTEKDVTLVSPHLYKYNKGTIAQPMRIRFFMIFNGKVVRMDQHSKRNCGPLKKTEELAACEWTIDESSNVLFRIPEGSKLEDAKVEVPVLINGVGISGESEDITVKNLIVMHFWNDGYNIHNLGKNIGFETIAALYNGDDSLSAHENNTVTVRNIISIGNATGICHGGGAQVLHENMYIAQSDSRDFFLLNKQNTFRHISIVASAPATSEIGDKGSAELAEMQLYSEQPGAVFRVQYADKIDSTDLAFVNYKLIGTLANATLDADAETVKKKVNDRRDQLFSLFSGKIEEQLKP